MADPAAETKPKVENSNVINLVVKDQNDTEVFLEAKPFKGFLTSLSSHLPQRM